MLINIDQLRVNLWENQNQKIFEKMISFIVNSLKRTSIILGLPNMLHHA